MAITISGDSPNLTNASLTTPTLTSPTFAGTPSGSIITSMTAQASTSGTSIDFTSIPSWVKRITVLFNGVSTNGSSAFQVQIGAGSITSAGYLGKCVETTAGSGTGSTTYSAGYLVARSVSASMVLYGKLEIDLVSANIWLASGVSLSSATDNQFYFSGSLSLGGTLDRVRITTSGGTDTFDAGSINILYE
jgi:hypothetical protein